MVIFSEPPGGISLSLNSLVVQRPGSSARNQFQRGIAGVGENEIVLAARLQVELAEIVLGLVYDQFRLEFAGVSILRRSRFIQVGRGSPPQMPEPQVGHAVAQADPQCHHYHEAEKHFHLETDLPRAVKVDFITNLSLF